MCWNCSRKVKLSISISIIDKDLIFRGIVRHRVHRAPDCQVLICNLGNCSIGKMRSGHKYGRKKINAFLHFFVILFGMPQIALYRRSMIADPVSKEIDSEILFRHGIPFGVFDFTRNVHYTLLLCSFGIAQRIDCLIAIIKSHAQTAVRSLHSLLIDVSRRE